MNSLEDKKKLRIVKEELALETHNGTTKADLLMLLDWTYNRLIKGDLEARGMNVLEKILENVERLEDPYYKDYVDRKHAAEIIRSHMGEVKNDWIPVEEKLPEVGEIVEVTVHSSEWIADYSSGWVPEEEKTYHAEEHNVYYGYLNGKRQWVFYDDENSENICEKEFGTDKGRVYDVVTAWRLKPEPYIKNPK